MLTYTSVYGQSGAITPDDLGLLARLAGTPAAVRDESSRLVWCNAAFAAYAEEGSVPEDHLGMGPDGMAEASARERFAVLERVTETGRSEAWFELVADYRVLADVHSIDRDAFGHGGVLIVLSPGSGWNAIGRTGVGTLRTPAYPRALSRLTRRELEVLYLSGEGLSAPQMAKRLFRSTKTMEHHVAAVHHKLGLRGKGDLVRYCVERGLHGFGWETWLTIIGHMVGPDAD